MRAAKMETHINKHKQKKDERTKEKHNERETYQ